MTLPTQRTDHCLRGGHAGLVVGEQVSRSGGGVLVQTRRYQMSRQFWNLGRFHQFELASALDLVGTPGQFGAASSHERMVRNGAKARAEADVSRRPPGYFLIILPG